MISTCTHNMYMGSMIKYLLYIRQTPTAIKNNKHLQPSANTPTIYLQTKCGQRQFDSQKKFNSNNYLFLIGIKRIKVSCAGQLYCIAGLSEVNGLCSKPSEDFKFILQLSDAFLQDLTHKIVIIKNKYSYTCILHYQSCVHEQFVDKKKHNDFDFVLQECCKLDVPLHHLYPNLAQYNLQHHFFSVSECICVYSIKP